MFFIWGLSDVFNWIHILYSWLRILYIQKYAVIFLFLVTLILITLLYVLISLSLVPFFLQGYVDCLHILLLSKIINGSLFEVIVLLLWLLKSDSYQIVTFLCFPVNTWYLIVIRSPFCLHAMNFAELCFFQWFSFLLS